MGEMFGRYRLDARLGSGGVGEVWRAYDTALDRVVALKMLLAQVHGDPDATARFHREARMAGRLRHRNIVRVHTFGEIDSRLYLDMELIDGADLRAVIRSCGSLDLPRALRIVEQVAAALDHAHGLDGPADRMMVHRDVKPANVMLEPSVVLESGGMVEHVYLADFGVARAVRGGTAVTRDGEINGTPDYMAPELWQVGPTDHRVDVYSLAVMLFEMATGALPFPRPTLEATIAAHLTVPPPVPSSVDPRLPRAFDEVVVRGLAKDPDRRYPRAGDLAAAAAAALRSEPAARPMPPDHPTRYGPRESTVVLPAPTRPVTSPNSEPVPARAGVRDPAGAPIAAAPEPAAPEPAVPEPAVPEPAVPEPAVPESGAPEPVAPDPPAPAAAPYFASRPHFAGLACTAPLLPAYLLGVVHAGPVLLLYLVLLYGLGALVGGLLPPRR